MTKRGTTQARNPADAFRADSRVADACKQILRFIRAHALTTGDRLPTQPELRAAFGFSNHTLSSAMAALVENGVLVRKRKLGTVIADPDARGRRPLWSVGLASFLPVEPLASSFFAHLSHRLQLRLVAAGCRCHVYVHSALPDGLPPVFEDFDDLEEDLAAGRLDGALTPVMRARAHSVQAGPAATVPIVHVGSWEVAPEGVVIEQGDMVRAAVALLASRGCRRLAVVGIGPPKPGYDRFWAGFQAGLANAGLAATDGECIHAGPGMKGGEAVAHELLARRPPLRPTGLIVLDDWIAMGLTGVLAGGNGYRPQVTVQSNAQAPLAYPLPVFRFELDVEELAARAVQLLLARIENPLLAARLEWLTPRLSEPEPAAMPATAATTAAASSGDG
jgi:DNA-binding LacI/PurR family transcriptional regulator